jgi:hypothetical protein
MIDSTAPRAWTFLGGGLTGRGGAAATNLRLAAQDITATWNQSSRWLCAGLLLHPGGGLDGLSEVEQPPAECDRTCGEPPPPEGEAGDYVGRPMQIEHDPAARDQPPQHPPQHPRAPPWSWPCGGGRRAVPAPQRTPPRWTSARSETTARAWPRPGRSQGPACLRSSLRAWSRSGSTRSPARATGGSRQGLSSRRRADPGAGRGAGPSGARRGRAARAGG